VWTGRGSDARHGAETEAVTRNKPNTACVLILDYPQHGIRRISHDDASKLFINDRIASDISRRDCHALELLSCSLCPIEWFRRPGQNRTCTHIVDGQYRRRYFPVNVNKRIPEFDRRKQEGDGARHLLDGLSVVDRFVPDYGKKFRLDDCTRKTVSTALKFNSLRERIHS
jgi:hypothetical protein